jgi:hypothetical protein
VRLAYWGAAGDLQVEPLADQLFDDGHFLCAVAEGVQFDDDRPYRRSVRPDFGYARASSDVSVLQSRR